MIVSVLGPSGTKPPLEIGARWAYREHFRELGGHVIQAEILQFAPSHMKTVRVRYIDGPYPDLMEWVPRVRLLIPWDEAADLLRDEQRLALVRAASRATADSFEREAATRVTDAHPHRNVILIDDEGTVEIGNPARVEIELGTDWDGLFADPLAFIDRRGTYRAPWTTALRLARRVCEVFPEHVLNDIGREERNLQERAVTGYTIEDNRGRWDDMDVSAETCAQSYREKQPLFAVVRSWCHIEETARFDEVSALREENARLRAVIESVIPDYEYDGRFKRAAELRRAIGLTRPRKRRGLSIPPAGG